MNAISTKTRKWAAAAIGGTGLIHLLLAPDYLGTKPYVGALFLGGAAACGYVAVRLWRATDVARDWLFGAATALGMFVGFILSRISGLLGFQETEWEPLGLVSMALEAGFVAVAINALRRPTTARSGRIATSGSAARAR